MWVLAQTIECLHYHAHRQHCKWLIGATLAFLNVSIKKPHCSPIILLFFHIISYLHKKQPVNYLTRGVKKKFQIAAVKENIWVSINHYHMTTHVLKVERSSMSVIQHCWRTPLLSLSLPHRSEGAPRQEECWRLDRRCGMINLRISFTFDNLWEYVS